jgi:predicted kinase
MEKDCSDEVKDLVKKYKKEDIVFGKPLDLLLSRVKIDKAEVEEEILSCDNLSLVEKQIKDSEIRYKLFFVYSRKKGREYVVTFRDNNLRIITIFPLGRKTLKKYRKKGLNMQ